MQKIFTCSVCGTRYRHKGMAARCQRTDVCRWYHAPGGERRKAYTLQVRVCAAVAYICAPVSAQAGVAEVEAQAWKALHLVDSITNGLDALSVSRDIYRRVNDAALRGLESIWEPTATVDVVHIVAIVASLVGDLRRELGLVGLKAQGVALGEKLDDGRSAADLLALAQTVPCILGRTG